MKDMEDELDYFLERIKDGDPFALPRWGDGEIKLLKDTRLRESLLSIQFEWTDQGNFRIFGRDSHITEALIRACWCIKSKQLNIMAFC